MSVVWAEKALTAAGWQSNVCVEVGNDGRIISLESGIEIPANAAATRVGVLLPALSNVHSHAFQRAMAGLTERKGSQINDSFWTWRQKMYKFVDAIEPDDLQAIAALVQMEMLESGFSSVGEFHYLHHGSDGTHFDRRAEMSERIVSAANDTGIGLSLLPVLYQQGGCDGRSLSDGQLRFGNTLDGYLRLHEQASAALSHLQSDSSCGVALHSLRAVDKTSLAYFADGFNDLPIHIHIAEQVAEIEEVSAYMGARPVQWLLDNCAVNERWCLVHATHLDDKEVAGIAASQSVVGLCPITEANLGDGVFRGVDFLKAHGRIGIGSDSNVRISLAEELRLLEYSQRLEHKKRTLLANDNGSNGRLLYEQSARGGAQALGRGDGLIEVGAFADLISLDTEAVALIERDEDDILDSWLFAGDDSLVQNVWSAGRHVVVDGRHHKREAIVYAYQQSIRRLSKA